ncbi:hypothetical protein Dsin_009501 [Dipteronia sinensis]|uniref:Uncharacterized protein n=1 Tax=Dipteronia sinensis TaxID=43782 RepID=A0AAE0AQM9_9ROSI|nr:hypothetical protein Dsin_009501 [Dipteronia sinensis]
MVGVGGDEGSRRRLPSWMLGVVQQPGNENENETKATISTQQHNVTHSNVTNKNRSNRLGRKVCQQPEKEYETKETGTSISTQLHKEIRSNVTNKNGSNRLGRRVGQKRKDKCVSDDAKDAELTVQDLLSIAKEYVEADAVTAEVQSSTTHFESQNQLLTTIAVEKDSKGSFAAPNNSVRTSLTHPTTASCNSASSLTGENCLLSAATTGDPAQDMLDLFLGPLLKKPIQQEKKTEFTANDMVFSNKLQKLSQSDVREEIVYPMKTKSSLKDKVAMLLD